MSLREWLLYVLALLVGALGFIWRRETNRIDAHDERIRRLELNHVTRNDIDELRQSIMATIVQAAQRNDEQVREMRSERIQMHAENRETLDRIHERVDALWERRRFPRDP